MQDTGHGARPVTGVLDGYTVGVLSALFAGVYFGSLVSLVACEVERRGGHTLALQTQGADWRSAAEGGPPDLHGLGWDRIGGLVVIGDSAPRTYLEAAQRFGKPLVMISGPQVPHEWVTVAPDNRGGAMQAVAHLVAHGHERIAFAGDLSNHDVRQRYYGYSEAMRAAGCAETPALVFSLSDSRAEGGLEMGQRLGRGPLPFTAVVAGTDYNALGLMVALEGAGHEIPDEVAVVGFDDMPEAQLATVPLSTVSQDLAAVAARAVKLLATQLDGRRPAQYLHMVPTALVLRQSCGCSGPTAGTTVVSASTDPVELFAAQVTALLGSGLSTEVHARAAEIGACLVRAALEPPSASELLRVERLTSALCTGDGRQDPMVVPFLARRLAALLAAPGSPQGSGEGVERCLDHVTRGAARAPVLEQATARQRLAGSVSLQWGVSMALLGAHERDPRSLSWLPDAAAQAAVLALWDGPGPGELGTVLGAGTLKVVGSKGIEIEGSERTLSPSEFPPVAMADFATAHPGSLLLAMPLRTRASNWGFLSLVVRNDPELISHDTFFHWTALLGQALDYDAVATSLRQRNDELAALEAQLSRQALYDGLTGLPNRALFLDRLRQAMANSRRSPNDSYAVVWLDLDGFKAVNDTFGHLAGDKLLEQVAQRLARRLRQQDTPARLGGDEFAALLVGAGRPNAVSRAVERIRADLDEPYEIDGARLRVTASIGIATSAGGYSSAEDVLRDADAAMYRSKTARRANGGHDALLLAPADQ
ncbi:MAG TPA: GGDEF domain-containing protein [Acidimicrobiales bacterium]|nr:GGDEF domain-containing protein [Acidimicrobiales bacterium]